MCAHYGDTERVILCPELNNVYFPDDFNAHFNHYKLITGSHPLKPGA